MQNLTVVALACATLGAGCLEASDEQALRGTVGPEGGELVGLPGTPFEGVRLEIPPGALSGTTALAILRADSTTPLPVTAVRCGPMFSLQPAGLALKLPASLTPA